MPLCALYKSVTKKNKIKNNEFHTDTHITSNQLKTD